MDKILRSKEVIHRYLANGMEVYLHPSDFAPLVSLQVLVKAGSIDEADFEAGVAHVLEHMLFKGTHKHPGIGEIASTVEASGGDINAYTTFDHTLYYITAPSGFAAKGTEILLDVVQNSLLEPTELARELEVVIEEIRRGRDNPSSIVAKNLFKMAYKDTRLGRPVIGFEEVVGQFTGETVQSFYKRWYCPNNMIFIAAGDFDPEEMLELLHGHAKGFSPVSLAERERPALPEPRKAFVEAPVSLARGPFQEARVQLAVRAPSLESTETAAWEIFASVLGHGDTSRLTTVIRDELQLVTTIDANVFTPRYPEGLLSIGFFGRANSALMALQSAVGEIKKLAQNGPSSDEMRRVMAAVRAERIYAKESVEGIGRTAASALMTSSKLRFDEEFLEQLKAVRESDLQKIAGTVLAALACGHFHVSCALARDSLPELTEEDLRAAVRTSALPESISKTSSTAGGDAGALAALNPPGISENSKATLQVSESNPAVKQLILPLPHGRTLHVNFRHSERLPITSGMLVWRGGMSLEPAQLNGVSAALAQMLTRGTRKQSYRNFVAELEDYASGVSAFSSKDTFGIRFDALSEHTLRTFDMVLDCLFRPAFDPEEWQRVRKETEDVLIAQKDSPSNRLSRLSGPLLFGSHTYALPSLGTEASLERLTLNDIQAQWTSALTAPRDFVLSLAGTFNLEALAKRVQAELSTWLENMPQTNPLTKPMSAQEASLLKWHPQMSDNRVGYDEIEREQAHITVSFRAIALTDSRRTALELAANILAGQGGRLFLDLRDRRSLAYSVGASQSPALCAGVFTTYIATAAHKVEEAVLGLKLHIERLAVEPPTEEELSRAKRSVLGSQLIDSQHHHYQASQLAMSDVYGLGYDNFLRFEERVTSVTSTDIQNLVRELLANNPPVICIVGPKGVWVPRTTDASLSWSIAGTH